MLLRILSLSNLTKSHKLEVKEHTWAGFPWVWVHIEFILILIYEEEMKINVKRNESPYGVFTKPMSRMGQEKKEKGDTGCYGSPNNGRD